MFTVGEKLKRFRKRKNMSQMEFAQFLEISQNYLSEIESGKYIPSWKKLEKIANKLNTTVAKLIEEKTA
jgi:transcriptional regulator with XRE-family HTH domain